MRHFFLSFVLVGSLLLVGGRSGVQPVAAQSPAEKGGAPAAKAAADTGAESGATSGTVVETMDAGSYTYVQVDDGSKKIWAAAPQFTVAVGDKVVVPQGDAMRDFHSKTLQRTFDVIYFVPAVQVVGGHGGDKGMAAHGAAGQAPAAPAGAGHAMAGHSGATTAQAAGVDLSNIRKADGGETIAELFEKKAALAGKDVAVRARVVKFTPNVMGKNWLHVQDGTGAAGTNDLTVSTSATAAVGNTVLVRGKLATDKDLGFGYHYDAIIEDATVAVE